MQLDTIVVSDALAYMRGLPDASVDAIITDLPYGTTACSWDEIIPFDPMWAAVKRVLKPRGAFVTTASQPFTSKLIMSNLDWFKYSWVWVKSNVTDVFNASFRPLKKHEDVLVFSSAGAANGAIIGMNYSPQGLTHSKRVKTNRNVGGSVFGSRPSRANGTVHIQEYTNYPTTILDFATYNNTSHPSEKPVELYEYLIRTYTQPGETVLDFCCGSGTTGRAAQLTGRHYLLCDSDPAYVQIALDRLAQPYTPNMFTDEPAAASPVNQQTALW